MSGYHPTARRHLSEIENLLLHVESDLGLPLILTLVIVARHPGLSVTELAERLGAPQQTASRYVGSLKGRYETPGMPLTMSASQSLLALEVNQFDPRRRALFLTPSGKKRINSLLSAYSRAHEE